MKIVFFGTSSFGAIILEKLVQADLSPVLVVTAQDKPAGRKQELTPPPVKVVANKLGISIFQPPNLKENAYVQTVRQAGADLFVVASYGKILPRTLLGIPKKGSLNVHPSLLPKYRGSSPIQTAILNGEEETGVTIMLLDEKMDHGPVAAVATFGMQGKKYTYPELHNALAELGGDLLIQTIPLWVEGKIEARTQDDSKATYTAILQKEDGRIDWNQSVVRIERQIRAFCPWPGTFTTLEGRNLKILKALVLPTNLAANLVKLSFAKLSLTKFAPGTVFLTADKKLAIKCGGDALLVEALHLEGGKPMSSKEFLLGHKDFLGTILE